MNYVILRLQTRNITYVKVIDFTKTFFLMYLSYKLLHYCISESAGIYLFKFNNKKTRTMSEICSELAIKRS